MRPVSEGAEIRPVLVHEIRWDLPPFDGEPADYDLLVSAILEAESYRATVQVALRLLAELQQYLDHLRNDRNRLREENPSLRAQTLPQEMAA
jgi:hypothetical protein